MFSSPIVREADDFEGAATCQGSQFYLSPDMEMIRAGMRGNKNGVSAERLVFVGGDEVHKRSSLKRQERQGRKEQQEKIRGIVHQADHQSDWDVLLGLLSDLILAVLASWRFKENGINQPTFFRVGRMNGEQAWPRQVQAVKRQKLSGS